MMRIVGGRSAVASVLAVAALTMATAMPAQAQTGAGKLGNEFITTYYANAAHTGSPVGQWIYGYCPGYFSNTWGTKTAYHVMSEEAC